MTSWVILLDNDEKGSTSRRHAGFINYCLHYHPHGHTAQQLVWREGVDVPPVNIVIDIGSRCPIETVKANLKINYIEALPGYHVPLDDKRYDIYISGSMELAKHDRWHYIPPAIDPAMFKANEAHRTSLPGIDGITYVGQYYGMKSHRKDMKRLQDYLLAASQMYPVSVYGDNWDRARPSLRQFHRGYCDFMDLWSVYRHSVVVNTTKGLDHSSVACNLRPMETWASGGILWSDPLPPEFDGWYIPLGEVNRESLNIDVMERMRAQRDELRRVVCERYNYHIFVDKLLRLTREY